jgi:DNA repair exonuclease SbcCD ATPase subunit
MENIPTKENEKKYPIYQEPKRKVPMILVAAVITLAVVAVFLGIKLYVDNKNNAENVQFIEGEKGKLEKELNGLIVEYDSLKTKADTLDTQLEAEQDRIKKLLSINASNATKISMYKSELETLRKVMKSYIVQIDSLNTKNQMLASENMQVKEQLGKANNDYQELSQKSEELSTTVKIAQKLNAKNIVAEGQNKNSKSTERIKKIEKIKVCCTVRENSVAKAGKKIVYLRISRPDDVVLSSPDAGTFECDGKSMAYSAKRELEYENADIDMCIFWDKTEELIAGTYSVRLYSEGYEIGYGSMVFK